ncbi:T9SS type B sorting domain-containing protein, partial [Bacteroidota bacterium]
DIWVEPTPRLIITPQVDTLCNDFSTNITVQIPTVSTNEVRYKFEIEKPEGVNVAPVPDYDQISGSVIIDSISNTTLSVQQVLFIITPYTWDANDNEKCPGTIDTAVIWINPTPVINVALPNPGDTLYCNGSDVIFSISTDNGNIIGEKVYDITASYSVFDVTGVTEGGPYLNDNTGFTDVLVNSHDSIVQKVTYTITPRFINVASDQFECTRGIDTTISVYIAATLRDTLISDSVYWNAYVGPHDVRCFGDDDASITLLRWGGFGSFLGNGYQYDWEPNTGIDPTARNQNGLGAGFYYVEISDDQDCSIKDTIELTQPEKFYTKFDSVTNNLCGGGSQAILHTFARGGVTGYDFTWTKAFDPGFLSKEQSPSGLITGIYHLDVYDTNLCYHYMDTLLLDPAQIEVVYNNSRYGRYQIACYGDTNGFLEVIEAYGGTGDYWDFTYEWRTAFDDSIPYATGIRIDNIPEGDYYLTVYDTLNCANIYYTPSEIRQPDPITFTDVDTSLYGGIYGIQCYDSINGHIRITDNVGGSTRTDRKHFYTWATPDGIVTDPNAQNQENLPWGTYYVSVSDSIPGVSNYNCELSDGFTLARPQQLTLQDTLSYYNGYEISCADSATGWIAVDVSGELDNLQDPSWYDWTYLGNGNSVLGADSVYGLVAGQYQVTVTDSLGCPGIWTFQLDQPPQLTAFWKPLDYNGVNVSCFGLSDGEIDTTIVTGGVESYIYEWTRESGGWNPTIAQPAGLIADIYTLRVTDTNGCQIYYSDTLIQPESLIIGNIETTRPACNGAWNGTIVTDTISGGTLPYTISWDTPNSDSTKDVIGLPQGNYTIVVWDVNNCIDSASTVIDEPDQLVVSIDTISLEMYNNQMIRCYGESNAVLGSIMNGGTRPYDFKWYYYETGWNLFSSDSVISNRPIGRHRVVMTDIYDCVDTTEIIITQPENLRSQSFVSDAECYNEPSGSIDFHMAGGTSPYEIRWLNGETDSKITDLLAGEYYVVVQDTNSCVYDTTIVVDEPDTLAVNPGFIMPGCPDSYDGSIWLNPSGGTPPYIIIWADGQSSEVLESLAPESYMVEVMDDHFCTSFDTIILISDAESCLKIPTAFTPNADGYNDKWEIEGMIYYPEATMKIFNRWGELIYETKNYLANPWDGTYRGVKVPVDSYHFVLIFTNSNPEITGHVTVIK